MALRRLFYGLMLTVSLVFYGAYQQWVSFVLLIVAVGLPWLSLILSLPAMMSARMEIQAPPRLRTGDQCRAALLGRCRLPLPPMRGRIRVRNGLTGQTWLMKSGRTLPTAHCGGLTLTPVRVRVYDYLGLVSRRLRKNGEVTVPVLPMPVELAIPPDLSRYLARAWRPKAGGGYAENHELRLYRPGDNLNQVHWKMSAKTGKLILREPMVPERGLVLLTLDVAGTAEELDTKFGRLLWLGEYLLEKGLTFEVRALTGAGIESRAVSGEASFSKCVEGLLCAAPAGEGSIRDREFRASWQYYIGGGTDEA